MRQKDIWLDGYSKEMDAAQRKINSAQARVDDLSSRRSICQDKLDGIKFDINDLKQKMDDIRRSIGICKKAHNHSAVDHYRYELQCYRFGLADMYDIKSGRLERSLMPGLPS